MRRAPRWYEDWRVRHRTAVSFWLHVVGIPLTVATPFLIGYQVYHDMWDAWWRPAALFAAGYLLQWIGHAYEGNDMGEVILVKRMLNLPYVAVAPRHGSKSD